MVKAMQVSLALTLNKAKAFNQLLKLKLSMLVALSAMFGYAMAAGPAFSWMKLLWMGLGGLMITGASNALNQIFEKSLDQKMKRTAQRPLPSGQLSENEALVFALLVALGGLVLLGYHFNLASTLLGVIGLISYAFVYTPMKQVSPFSVFVGAIPGSLPPLIGWVAVTGAIDLNGLLLFGFQFFWQFPHFWAIAWRLDEDYQRAGFKMLPTPSGKSKASARLMLIYTLCLVPLAYFPWEEGMIEWWAAIGLAALGMLFAFPALRLFQTLDGRYAKQLMFASFLYLPLIQLVFLFGKI